MGALAPFDVLLRTVPSHGVTPTPGRHIQCMQPLETKIKMSAGVSTAELNSKIPLTVHKMESLFKGTIEIILKKFNDPNFHKMASKTEKKNSISLTALGHR